MCQKNSLLALAFCHSTWLRLSKGVQGIRSFKIEDPTDKSGGLNLE